MSGSTEEQYAARVQRWEMEAKRLDARSSWISNFRGLSFATALISGIASVAGAPRTIAVPLCVFGLAAFVVLVFVHGGVLDALDLAERRADVNRAAIRRLTHAWGELIDQGEGLAPDDHPYAGDLDVFGHGSLFQRVSVARTRFGRARLAELLLTPADPPEARLRQGAVRELAGAFDLRQEFEAQALGIAGKPGSRPGTRQVRLEADPEPLLRWAESEPALLADRVLVGGAVVLPVLTLAALVAWLGFDLSYWPTVALLALDWLVNTRAKREVRNISGAVAAAEGDFLRYSELLRILEQARLEHPRLRELAARLQTPLGAPSIAMKRFRRWVLGFDLRHSWLYPFANLILLWDLNCTLGLERWKRGAGKHLRGWFDVLGWFEAFSSLASFAADEPDVVYPTFSDEAPLFNARALAHPLLLAGRRVANDVRFDSEQRVLLVTGSNMSGKSTLLRSVGLACVLAFAGAPVTARELVISRLRLGTSIRTSDSLAGGVSRFFAEIKRLKEVVDAAEPGTNLLFLLDEVLQGTNSRERQIGARWVLSELLSRGAIGALSTHDEELCRLPPELMREVVLVHLRESIQNGEMTFDYKVYPGPVTSGNALRLMRQIGLEVPLA